MGKVRQATWKPLVAWSLTGSVLVVLAAALVLLGLNASRLNASRLDAGQIGLYGLLSVGVLAYAGAGGLIARRVPGNAIGWLLSLAGLSLTVAMLTEQYALYGLATAPGTVPAAKVAGVLSAATVALTVILLFVLVLLFPDGRLPSPRWRPVLWALAVVAAGLVAQQFQAGTMISGGITNALNGPGVSYPDPLGVLPQNGWFSGLLAGIFILALVAGLLVVASVFVRRRGASPERRQQLAWLGYVGALTVVWAVLLVLANLLVRGQANGLVTGVFWPCPGAGGGVSARVPARMTGQVGAGGRSAFSSDRAVSGGSSERVRQRPSSEPPGHRADPGVRVPGGGDLAVRRANRSS